MIDIVPVTPKKVLIVEDDSGICEQIQSIFEKYDKEIESLITRDAGEALEKLKSFKPDAIIIDIMMSYGNAQTELKGETDPNEIEAGLRLLEFIREKKKNTSNTWVAVITARSIVAIENRVKNLSGKLYCKPFSSLQLEDDLMKALNIKSKVPPFLLQ